MDSSPDPINRRLVVNGLICLLLGACLVGAGYLWTRQTPAPAGAATPSAPGRR
jgi:hypothetical protein